MQHHHSLANAGYNALFANSPFTVSTSASAVAIEERLRIIAPIDPNRPTPRRLRKLPKKPTASAVTGAQSSEFKSARGAYACTGIQWDRIVRGAAFGAECSAAACDGCKRRCWR